MQIFCSNKIPYWLFIHYDLMHVVFRWSMSNVQCHIRLFNLWIRNHVRFFFSSQTIIDSLSIVNLKYLGHFTEYLEKISLHFIISKKYFGQKLSKNRMPKFWIFDVWSFLCAIKISREKNSLDIQWNSEIIYAAYTIEMGETSQIKAHELKLLMMIEHFYLHTYIELI